MFSVFPSLPLHGLRRWLVFPWCGRNRQHAEQGCRTPQSTPKLRNTVWTCVDHEPVAACYTGTCRCLSLFVEHLWHGHIKNANSQLCILANEAHHHKKQAWSKDWWLERSQIYHKRKSERRTTCLCFFSKRKLSALAANFQKAAEFH